jgi:hypothetical protein
MKKNASPTFFLKLWSYLSFKVPKVRNVTKDRAPAVISIHEEKTHEWVASEIMNRIPEVES